MSMYRFLGYRVEEFMTTPVKTVALTTPLGELEALFDKYNCNAFPVVDHDRVVGFATKLDFLKAFTFTTRQMVPHYNELMQKTVADVMTEAVVHVEPDAPLTRALQLMVSLKARSFPVIGASGKLAGIIAREDIMRALKAAVAAGDA